MNKLLLHLCKLVLSYGLLLLSLQPLAAQQDKNQSLLLKVNKTIEGNSVIQASNERPAMRSATQSVQQENDDLQSYLDNAIATRAGVITVDLSEFGATDRKTPLYVRDGESYLFTNGTLTRNAALDNDAVMIITDGSVVEWGKGAILSGGGFATGHELVLLEKGSFTVTTGTIRDSFCESTEASDEAVYLKAGTSFSMTGGLLYNTGGIDNRDKGSLSLLGGQIAGGGVLALSDFTLSGTADVAMVYMNLYDGAKILVRSGLQKEVDCIISDSKANRIVATGTGSYKMTQTDVSKFIYSDPEVTQTKEWEYALANGNIVLKEKTTIEDEDDLQKYLDDLAGKGTEENPEEVIIPDVGITITKPLTIPGCHINITGGPISFSGPGGYFHVGGGGHVWFVHIKIIWITTGGGCDWGWRIDDGGTVDFGEGVDLGTMNCKYGIYIGKGASVNMHGGTIRGCEWGVYNNGGTFNLYGGTISGNRMGGIYNGIGSTLKLRGGNVYENTKYDVYSLTCFWLSGSCNVKNIWLGKGVCIYVTSTPKHKWEIHFIGEFEIGTTIIIGDGYPMTPGDITFITIYVPGGHEWYWDPKCGCVEIREGGDDAVIDTQEKLQKAIDKATGTCSGQPTVIEISGTISISNLDVMNKAVTLKGGVLLCNGSRKQEGVIFVKNGCLTLEDITIQGNLLSVPTLKTTIIEPLILSTPVFSIEKSSMLTINEGTVIRKHGVDFGDMGLIVATEKSSVIMNAGSICNNSVTSSYVVTTFMESSFTMNGGSIFENKVGGLLYGSNIFINNGVLKNNSSHEVWFNDHGSIHADVEFVEKPILNIYSANVILYGDAKLGGNCDIHLKDKTCLINISGAINNEVLISHSDYIYPAANEPSAGTVIAKGYDGYKLTEADLAKFTYKDNKWDFALDKAKNTIILKEAGDDNFGTGDDLQEYLDKLAQEGQKGTPESPVKINKFPNELPINKPINIPPGMSVKFVEGELVDNCTSCSATINVPNDGTLYLGGTTVKAGPGKEKGSISNIGKVIVEEGSTVDYIDNLPGGNFVLDGGTIGTIGKTVDCINIAEGSDVSLKSGQIGGNIKTASDIYWGGDMRIGGCIYIRIICKIRLTSALKSNVKIGYETLDATPGTIVVCGGGGYQLTNRDLNYLISMDNGCKFEFKGDDIVIADPATANDEVTANQISVSASNGTLVLSGLTAGEEYAIYAMDGRLVYKGKATDATVYYSIKSDGIYFVRYKNVTTKVVNVK